RGILTSRLRVSRARQVFLIRSDFPDEIRMSERNVSTGDAPVGVLRAEADEEFDGFWKRLDAFARAVRHVSHGDSVFPHDIHSGALGHEVEDHFVVSPRGRAVQWCV